MLWSLILAIVFIAYYVLLLIVQGLSTFNILFLFVGLSFLILYIYERKYKHLRDKNKRGFLEYRRKFIIVISVITGFLFLVDGVIFLFGMNKNNDKSDIVMVLGAGLDGDQISPMLKTRLDGAIDYIKQSDGKELIVVSGGQGHDEKISEAEAMKKYLIKNGVSTDRIIMEDKSTSTFENFKFSKDIIETETGKYIEDIDIKVFTNGFHCMRSYFLSKRLDYGNVSTYGTRTPFYLAPVYYLREIAAFGKSIVFDK